MNNQIKATLGIGILILGVSLWIVMAGAGTGSLSQGGFTTVKRGTLKMALTERGTLKTRNATRIRSEVHGRTQIEWMVDEGKKVVKGEVLVQLEKTEVQRRVDQLENELISIETNLNSARTDLIIQQDRNKTSLEKAKLSLEVAQVEKEKLLLGDIPKQERSLALSIEKAESELVRAEGLWEDMPEMLEKGFVTQDQFEQERINLKEKREGLVTAKQEQKLYDDFEKPLSIKQKAAGVTEALRNVEMETRQADTLIGNLKVKVNQSERALMESQEELDREKYDLDRMTIVAPVDGVIFYGNPDRPWDRDDIRVGGDARYNQIIQTIPDPKEMAVMIKIHEADIDKIATEMPAVIRSEVQKGSVFAGEVMKIDSVANAGDRRWGDQVRRFNVEVRLMGSDLDLKPGTSAEVEINIGEIEDVVYVPLQAVHAESGNYYCYLKTAGGHEKVPVDVGRSNESFLEIIVGLVPGQEILLYRPDASESTDQIQKTPNGKPTDEQTSLQIDESDFMVLLSAESDFS
ncbi:MAG: HlyD family efflux transporter periplasmic adaptor subunit [Planctomycetota bacterium]|nr:HlyD family efflux transporter periplasmic adaptor subunit [Planctomycetota bacterium]